MNTHATGAVVWRIALVAPVFCVVWVDGTQRRGGSVLEQRAVRGIGARRLRGPALTGVGRARGHTGKGNQPCAGVARASRPWGPGVTLKAWWSENVVQCV